MRQIRDFCRGCGKLILIQNKKYWLCGDCVFKKSHDGKTKAEVYAERATVSAKKQADTKIGDKVKRASKLKSVSADKRYRCSDGSMVSQAEIKCQLLIVKDKIKETRLPVCQGTGRTGVPLSFSHIISQARCKELGKTELIWSEDNIELEEFEAPTSNPTAAHNIWEVGTIEKKLTLLNIERKLEYIAQHDPETFIKYKIKIHEHLNSQNCSKSDWSQGDRWE